jgi:hypothetical protein
LHSRLGISPYEAFWGAKPRLDWLRTYGSKCWALIPKAARRKNEYKSIEGIFVGYYNYSKAYKMWIPRTKSVIKARDTIFDESNHIERITIHSTDDDDITDSWVKESHTTIARTHAPDRAVSLIQDREVTPVASAEPHQETPNQNDITDAGTQNDEAEIDNTSQDDPDYPAHTPKDFKHGPWLNPSNSTYRSVFKHSELR